MFLSVCFGTSGSERVKMTAEIEYKIWTGLQLNMAGYQWGVRGPGSQLPEYKRQFPSRFANPVAPNLLGKRFVILH